MDKKSVGMTLVELLVSIAIFSIILITLTTISAFSYRHIIDASRRSVLQQDASLVVEHITKNIKRAIGSAIGPNPGIRVSGNVIAMRVDRDTDGIPDDDGVNQWIAYNYVPAPSYRVDYFAAYDYPGLPPVGSFPTAGGEALSSRITGFSLIPQSGTNYVFILVTACFDPDETAPDLSSVPCGTSKNPSVTISSNIDTPMISYQ